MSEIDASSLSLVVSIESDIYSPEDSDWQKELRDFYTGLKKAMPDGRVEPINVREGGKEYRGDLPIWAEALIVAGIHSAAGVFFHAVLLWLEHRKHAAIKLKFPDGTIFNVSKETQKQIEEKFAQQAKQ